jgi:hypothetical protein
LELAANGMLLRWRDVEVRRAGAEARDANPSIDLFLHLL